METLIIIKTNMKNINVQEDYCSFEVSKLLNSKGLPGLKNFPITKKHWKAANLKYTHALAIKWIRENFGIHITALKSYNTEKEYTYEIVWYTDNIQNSYMADYYNSHEEATEAALLYTLENLIP